MEELGRSGRSIRCYEMLARDGGGVVRWSWPTSLEGPVRGRGACCGGQGWLNTKGGAPIDWRAWCRGSVRVMQARQGGLLRLSCVCECECEQRIDALVRLRARVRAAKRRDAMRCDAMRMRMRAAMVAVVVVTKQWEGGVRWMDEMNVRVLGSPRGVCWARAQAIHAGEAIGRSTCGGGEGQRVAQAR